MSIEIDLSHLDACAQVVERNYQKDSAYVPYCLPCPGLVRMKHTPLGWACHCGAQSISYTTIVRMLIDILMQPYLNVSRASLCPEANIQDDLGLDSIDHVEFLMDMEETFKIEIDDDRAQECDTVRDIATLVVTILYEKRDRERRCKQSKKEEGVT